MNLTNREHALEYARRYGLKVFPLKEWRPNDTKEECKHPACANGLNDATTDPVKINRLWRRDDYNIAMATGLRDNGKYKVILDIDPRHGGDKSLAELIAKYPGEIDTDTACVRTGTGGFHYHYLSDTPVPNSESKIAPGIDTRGGREEGEGRGYVLLPPSRHPNGQYYQWLKLPKEENYKPFPAVLAKLLDQATKKEKPKATGQSLPKLRQAHAGKNEPRSCSLPDTIPPGKQATTIFHWACGLVRGHSPEEVERLVWTAIQERCPNDAERKPWTEKDAIKIAASAERFRPDDWHAHPMPLRNYRLEQKETKIRNEAGEETGETKIETTAIPLTDYDSELREQAQYFYRIVDSDGHGDLYLDNSFRAGGPANEYRGEIRDKHSLRNAFGVLGRRIDFLSAHKGGKIQEETYLDWLRNNCRVFDRIKLCEEYPADPGTLYLCHKVEPRRTGKLRQLLETFTTADERSRYRIGAGILSSFLPRKFDGEKPLFSVVAPGDSNGKSSVVKTCAEIISGRPAIMLSLKRDNKDAFGSREAIANPVSCLDNLTTMKADETAELAKWITSRTIQSHTMYVSHGFYPNHYSWWATFNQEHALTSDLLARSVLITMCDWRTLPKEKQREKEKVSTALLELVAQREEILADIAWVFQEAKNAEPFPHIPHTKFSLWSVAMATLLHAVYPEISCFDFAVNEIERLHYDDECGLISSVLENLTANNTGSNQWHAGTAVVAAFQSVANGEHWTKNEYSLGRKLKAVAGRLPGWRIEYDRRYAALAGGKVGGWIIQKTASGTTAQAPTNATGSQSQEPAHTENTAVGAEPKNDQDLETLFAGGREDWRRLKTQSKNGRHKQRAQTDEEAYNAWFQKSWINPN